MQLEIMTTKKNKKIASSRGEKPLKLFKQKLFLIIFSRVLIAISRFKFFI